jgi:hypothetical protein
MQCYQFNVKKGLLDASAIIVEPGEGKEDRLMQGSYVELRQQEMRERKAAHERKPHKAGEDYFVPRSAKRDSNSLDAQPSSESRPSKAADDSLAPPTIESSDPFGLTPGK